MLSGIHILRTLYIHPVCRKLFALWLCLIAMVGGIMLTASFNPVWSQSCTINPSQPQPAMPGECVHFSASGCGSVNWTLAGRRHARSDRPVLRSGERYPQNYSRGIQQLPNSNAYNVSVYNWPVHPLSPGLGESHLQRRSRRRAAITTSNSDRRRASSRTCSTTASTSTTPKQLVHAVLPWCVGCQDTPLPHAAAAVRGNAVGLESGRLWRQQQRYRPRPSPAASRSRSPVAVRVLPGDDRQP